VVTSLLSQATSKSDAIVVRPLVARRSVLGSWAFNAGGLVAGILGGAVFVPRMI
jgi:hypothetical protein